MRSLRGGQRVPIQPGATDMSSDSLVRLGRAIRALREERGLKQIELAAAAGTSEAHVSRVESASTSAGWDLVMRLLDGMEATVSELADLYSREPADSGE